MPRHSRPILKLLLLVFLAGSITSMLPPAVTPRVAFAEDLFPNVVTTIPLSFPDRVVVNPTTNRVYMTTSNSIITVLNGSDNSVITTVTIPGQQSGISDLAVNQQTNKVYAVFDRSLSIVDGATHSVVTHPAEDLPYEVEVNAVSSRVYYLTESDSLVAADADGQTITSIGGVSLYATIHVDEVTETLYYSAPGHLIMYDRALQVVKDIVLPVTGNRRYPFTIDSVKGLAYVTIANMLYKITLADGSVQPLVTISTESTANILPTFNPTTGNIYLASPSNLYLYDTDTGSFRTANAFYGYGSSGPVINPDTNRVYIADPSGSRLVVLQDGEAQPPPENCFTDEFSGSTLSANWTWVDPLGDSAFSLTASPGVLRISTPDADHDFDPNVNTNAPRLVQAINGDFDVSTKVTINPTQGYQSAGLLVWFNDTNFMWIGRTVDNRITNRYHHSGTNFDQPDVENITNTTVYFRAVRTASTIASYYSLNGVNWTQNALLDFPPTPTTASVGMFLLSNWTSNSILADFDYFRRCGEDFTTPPVANFDASPHSGNAPLNVQFMDTSTSSITTWAWDFDNNGTTDSTQQNPSYTYTAAGNYSVKLTISGPGGTNTNTKANYITVLPTANTLSWKRSSIWTGVQEGPQDSNGHSWNNPEFDDTSWTSVVLPDAGSDSSNNDRYYRSHFTWDGASSLGIQFSSDDGLAIYVNGNLLGSWGYGWRQAGCVNKADTCAGSKSVPPQVIPTSMLTNGDNVIAVDLWNGQICCGYYLDVKLTSPQVSMISGRVTNATGTGISAVTVSAVGPTNTSVLADANGNYALSGLVAGSYTITPSKNGYSFNPASIPIILPPDVTDKNFTGRPSTITPATIFLPITIVTRVPSKVVIFLQGVNTKLTLADIKKQIDSGHSAASIVGMDKIPTTVSNVLPSDTEFFQYSYTGSGLKTGNPTIYTCQDTFSQPIATDISLLRQQISRIAATKPAGTEIEFYLIGHSLGGAVALGFVDFLEQHWLDPLPSGIHLKAVITLDSPIGGVHDFWTNSYIVPKVYEKSCDLKNVNLESPHNLTTVLNSTIPPFHTTPPADGEIGSLGAQASFLMLSTPPPNPNTTIPSNQFLAEQAQADLGTSFLTIGNVNDFVWNTQACSPLLPGFADTQWLDDQGTRSGLYGRTFASKSTCPGLTSPQLAEAVVASHNAVLSNTDVQAAIVTFLKGDTPNTLTPQ